jgi:hypothetical protein
MAPIRILSLICYLSRPVRALTRRPSRNRLLTSLVIALVTRFPTSVFITRKVVAVVVEQDKYQSQRQLLCSDWACSALQRRAESQRRSRRHKSLRQTTEARRVRAFLRLYKRKAG